MLNYSSFDLINSSQKAALEASYVAALQDTGRTNFLSLFNSGPALNEPLVSYQWHFHEYLAMISYPGVHFWKLKFGLSTTDPSLGQRIQLIFTGSDELGLEVTPHFRLLLQEFKASAIVPDALATDWLAAYNNLQQEEMIARRFLEVPQMIVAGNPVGSNVFLRGYTFEASDFINLVQFPPPPTGEQIEPGMVRIIFVNHAQLAQSDAVQGDLPGTIGVILQGSYEISGTFDLLYTQFYDISKPCPPTC